MCVAIVRVVRIKGSPASVNIGYMQDLMKIYMTKQWTPLNCKWLPIFLESVQNLVGIRRRRKKTSVTREPILASLVVATMSAKIKMSE